MKKSIITVFALLLTYGLSAQDTKTPSIHLDKEILDYGVINKGANKIKTIKVTNKGNAPLVIIHCEGTCGCTIPTCPKEPIMPGKSSEIEVSYDTNKIGEINKSVNIRSNDPVHGLKIVKLKGEVKDVVKNN